jgi:hypothetical protein
MQPPIAVPHLQTELKQIAEDVLKGVNGSATPVDTSGDSTPKTPSMNPSPSPKPPVPPRASGRSVATDWSKWKDHKPSESAVSEKTDLGELYEKPNTDAVVAGQAHNYEEEISPKDLPVRLNGVDGSENDPFLIVDRKVIRPKESRRGIDSNRGLANKGAK